MNVKNQAEKPAEVKVSKLPMLTDWEEYTTGKN
jgi:hypothetical protein